MDVSPDLVVDVSIAIGLVAFIGIIGFLLGKGVKALVIKVSERLGFDEWLRRFSFGRAIKRTGLSAGEFFGTVSSWILYVVFIVLGIHYGSKYLGLVEIAGMTQKLLNVYIVGFLKALIIIIIGFILADVFVSYIYKSSELRTEMQLLAPVAEYLRLLFYIVIVVFAIEQTGMSVEALTNMLTPIIWGLTVAMLLIIVFNIIQLTKGKPRLEE
jgi:hypothetical protein